MSLTAAPGAGPPSRAVQALAEAGKLASLTVAQLTKYLSLHGLPTGGKKAEVVARVAEHVQQA